MGVVGYTTRRDQMAYEIHPAAAATPSRFPNVGFSYFAMRIIRFHTRHFGSGVFGADNKDVGPLPDIDCYFQTKRRVDTDQVDAEDLVPGVGIG